MIQFTEQECRYLIDELRIKVPRDEDERMMISNVCLLYTSPSPRDATLSRMPSSA